MLARMSLRIICEMRTFSLEMYCKAWISKVMILWGHRVNLVSAGASGGNVAYRCEEICAKTRFLHRRAVDHIEKNIEGNRTCSEDVFFGRKWSWHILSIHSSFSDGSCGSKTWVKEALKRKKGQGEGLLGASTRTLVLVREGAIWVCGKPSQ